MSVDVSPESYVLGSEEMDFQTVGFSTDTKDVAANEWTKLYELDVIRGQGVVLGRGSSEAPQFAEGFAGIRLVSDSAAAQAEGQFRITIRNSNDRIVRTLLIGNLDEYDLFDGSGNKKARSDRRPFSLKSSTFETHEYTLALEVKVSSTITVDDAETQTAAVFEGFLAEKTN